MDIEEMGSLEAGDTPIDELPMDHLDDATLEQYGLSREDLLSSEPSQPKEEPKEPVAKVKKEEAPPSLDEMLKALADEKTMDESEDTESEATEEKEEAPEEQTTEEVESNESESEAEEVYQIMHKGEIKELSISELKELAQKGYDYTQKTQLVSEDRTALDDEVKLFEAEQEKVTAQLMQERQELDETYKIKAHWDSTIDTIEREEPELYEKIQDYFNSTVKTFTNPVINSELKAMREEIAQMRQANQQTEDVKTRTGFEADLKKVIDENGPRLSKMGIQLNGDKIQEAWIQSGGTVKEAMMQVYGSDITKAYESKLKLQSVKTKTKTKKQGKQLGGMRKAGRSSEAPETNTDNMTFQEMGQALAFS